MKGQGQGPANIEQGTTGDGYDYRRTTNKNMAYPNLQSAYCL